MKNLQIHRPGTIVESIPGIVDRVTYHNPENGWTVLRVLPFDNPLDVDFVIIDECAMLVINLAASSRRAIAHNSQILFIGDADQLPSVKALLQ
jgi:ATP-dependent exoDNAse (exonuclease V) alpha subunit